MENVAYSIINKLVTVYLPDYELRKKKKASRFLYLFDEGHGGINPENGVYQTPSKGHRYSDGFIINEGELNRKVFAQVLELAKELPFSLRFERLAHDWKDTPLSDRTGRANYFCDVQGKDNCKLLSIHHNGFTDPKANGVEVFSWGNGNGNFSTSGKKAAQLFNDRQVLDLHQFRNRGAKIANHHMTREANCTAILSEGGFSTNREDAEEMMSDAGILSYAKTIINWVLIMEEKE